MIFLGGPGRSGTSFVADRVQRHPQVASYHDVELKIFFEADGLFDLRSVLCRDYSPNRATVAVRRFDNLVQMLMNGGFAQPKILSLEASEKLRDAFSNFRAALYPHGFSPPRSYTKFDSAARNLVGAISSAAMQQKPSSIAFLEKTPHNLLAAEFLHQLYPDAKFIHVIRRPEAIAVSLLSQNWGPNDIETAAVWVRSYLEVWQRTRTFMVEHGLPLFELRIEDVSTDPRQASLAICGFLEIEPLEELFFGASSDVLDRWREKVDEHKSTILAKTLSHLSVELGYQKE